MSIKGIALILLFLVVSLSTGFLVGNLALEASYGFSIFMVPVISGIVLFLLVFGLFRSDIFGKEELDKKVAKEDAKKPRYSRFTAVLFSLVISLFVTYILWILYQSSFLVYFENAFIISLVAPIIVFTMIFSLSMWLFDKRAEDFKK